jgi:hypothetical protein
MRQELSPGGLTRERSSSQIGNRGFNPPEHYRFQNPDRRKGDLKEFPVGGKFPDREIGEFQETQKTQSQTELRKLVKLKSLSFLFILVINIVDCL